MPDSKLMSASDAVARFVADGDCVYAGYVTASFGLLHEVIRQRRRDLEIVGASVGNQGTLLFLAGCANRVQTGYVGGALRPGRIQDWMASGDLRFEDYSNQAIALRLMAGALGIPFIPTRSFLGTDYLRPEFAGAPGNYLGDQKWRKIESPFDGQPVVLLPALRPDVVLLHAQRADAEGNVQMWGHLGDARWGFWAGKKVIVSVEEVVESEVIMRDPSRTVVPGFRVSAVVHMPYGAHPAQLAGYYDTDYAFQAQAMRGIVPSEQRWQAFLAEWIDGIVDRDAYIAHYRERYGAEALAMLAASEGPAGAEAVPYTFAPTLRFG